ncbi:heterodisulfide reductase subunit C [Ferrithrix thermotolerans DSM 19514]|jgi:heterodisulfide reductase subunit C|uniref:Heterodisulfide reductase subunit C n=1 Tax=Ferrithrix thermotolerans DSM 19514 TaxID=1121881 RepID=A0A1M4WQE7_9ACTN|nr:4Fe-4S dicluster domain-containing protein [Ferrithrix thermotolerans]SHE83521.1 heterodisulfide reductase subunit C [Ferrithrix thermotolerans DSM 19514]
MKTVTEDPYMKVDRVAGHEDVERSTKESLMAEVFADPRFPHYLYGCYECGICVAACPSARFYDFSPRRVAQAAARRDIDLMFQQMEEDIWECSQCFSCLRCPRGNNPGGIITVMREVAVKNGLHSAQEALQGYSRIIFKIMSTGTQVSPDMLQPDAFPDWGPEVKDVSENLDLWRRALPPETHHTTKTGWAVADKTIVELYLIWLETGALDMIRQVDEGIHMILEEVMEERLEDEGIEI